MARQIVKKKKKVARKRRRSCPKCGGWLIMVAGEFGCYRCPWQPDDIDEWFGVKE